MKGPQQPGAYIARFGFNQKTLGILLASSMFTVSMVVQPDIPLLIRATGLLVFGVGGLAFLFVCLNGAVAFRADERGITLGDQKVGRRKPVSCVPWSSIAEVVLFRQGVGAATMRYVGLQLRPGAPSVPTGHNRDGRMWRITRRLVPHVPEDVLAHSRPIGGWRLDEEKLAHILAIHASHVQIVRLAEGRAHTSREGPASESFLDRQWRLLIKADFRRRESVAFGRGDNSLGNYLCSGPAGRLFSRLWNLLVTTGGLAGLAGLSATLTGQSLFSWWEIPLACAFFLGFCYFGLYHFAGWRCMRRHRGAAR